MSGLEETLPIWSHYKEYLWFRKAFDRISFYPVSEKEMQQLRANFRKGKFQLEIFEGEFSILKYSENIAKCYQEINEFKSKERDIDISCSAYPIHQDDCSNDTTNSGQL